jgi:lysophospholipase L1-like esterase
MRRGVEPVKGMRTALARFVRDARVALVLVVVALVAASEGTARLLFAAPTPVWLTHPFFGPVRPPGLRLEKVSFSGEPFVLEVNALGFRGKSLLSLAKPAGTYRIFFVGASTTENGDLPEEQTFAGIVEARLAEQFHGERRIEVGNAGVPGGTSSTSVAQVEHRILELEPNLVCVLDGMNDLTDSLREGWDPTTFHLATLQRPRFKDWLLSESRLLQILEDRLGKNYDRDARPMFAKKCAQRRSRPVRDPDFDVLRGLSKFRANQRRIATLCRAEGVALAFVTQPVLLKPELSPEEDARVWNTLVPGTDWNLKTSTLLKTVEAYNEATRETARSEGAILVDASATVPRDLRDFADDVHLTLEGNVAVADAVLGAIVRDGKLPAAGR